ncbi:MAG: phosphatidylserine decarboxylase family protein [Bacteroidota bacterium]|nr:phosphatidylserine decarboxylase family protein [Bacteroidota bacterium]
MYIHKAGYIPILVILALVLVILLCINLIFPVQSIIHYLLYGIAFVFIALVVRFFRVPKRIFMPDDHTIFSAADGAVVAIEEIEETEYFNDKRIQVSVFMSPLNVHVNWCPVNGTVEYIRHYPGKHHPAYLPKASLENEMTSVVLKTTIGHRIMVRQIAGIMARRIICKASPGLKVTQGDKLGIIKFGSRVDLILPTDCNILVELNQGVRAMKHKIAEFPS